MRLAMSPRDVKGDFRLTESRAWLCRPSEVPQRLEPVMIVDTERQLEDWAEADPTLLGDGYVVVGRQVQFDGGPADLVVIDPQGRWVIVEIKRAANDRQDLAQALDYAASLRVEDAQTLRARLVGRLSGKPYAEDAVAQIDAALADEGDGPREVAIMLVGVGLHPRAERIMNLLAEHRLDVRVGNFSAHRGEDGAMVLSRQIAEPAPDAEPGSSSSEADSSSLETLMAKARAMGCGEEFQRWVSLAESAGLYARPYKHSVMLTPPQHHNSYLSVARPLSGGRLRINHGPAEFAQWFPWISVSEVEDALGVSERGMGKIYEGTALDEYLDRLEGVLQRVADVPDDYAGILDDSAPWTRERFLALFASRPQVHEIAARFLDSVEPEGSVTFGNAAIGQAYLRYGPDAPVVLQVTGRARVQGMWSMGSIPRDLPGWEPLKHVLARFGGVTATGGSYGVLLRELSEEDAQGIIAAARATTGALAG